MRSSPFAVARSRPPEATPHHTKAGLFMGKTSEPRYGNAPIVRGVMRQSISSGGSYVNTVAENLSEFLLRCGHPSLVGR